MKNYSIQPVKDEDDNFWFCLYEHQSDQLYDYYAFREDAVKVKKFLDRGGAFDGFTPAFMLMRVSVPTDPNQEFKKLVDK